MPDKQIITPQVAFSQAENLQVHQTMGLTANGRTSEASVSGRTVTVTLRDYQLRDLNSVRMAMREHRAVLLSQPCGAGKGTLAAYIVHSAVEKGKRVLFLVNRRTLIHDMSERLDKLGVDHGIIMGDHPRRKPWLGVHVASIDTLHRRPAVPHADLLIIDETRFAISRTWKSVIDKYPDAKILGLDATPIRTDGLGLGEIYDFLVQESQVADLIAAGYLVPSRVFGAARNADADKLKPQRNGEFTPAQMAVLDKPRLIGDIVEHWKRLASDRKTVAFGADQHHCQSIAEQFRCAGVEFAYVDCDTSDDERKRIWDDFDLGSLRGIASVGVIGYGWDHPICSCIVQARITGSISVHLQQLGRGSRTYLGKTDFLVLDHAGNHSRKIADGREMGFYEDAREWSLNGAALPGDGTQLVSIVTCRRCYATFRRGPEECPYCGYAIERQSRTIEVDAGTLEEIQRERKLKSIEEWRTKVTGDKRREKFEELRKMATERGYSPKWPAVRFKVLFGQWPERGWGRTDKEQRA